MAWDEKIEDLIDERDAAFAEVTALRAQLEAARTEVANRAHFETSLRQQLAEAQAALAFGSLGQGAMVTFINSHYSVSIPCNDKWAELTHRRCVAVGKTATEAIANAKTALEGGKHN